jgi:hypothetical protein
MTLRLLLAAAAVAAVVVPATAHAGAGCTIYWADSGLVPENDKVHDVKTPHCAW